MSDLGIERVWLCVCVLVPKLSSCVHGCTGAQNIKSSGGNRQLAVCISPVEKWLSYTPNVECAVGWTASSFCFRNFLLITSCAHKVMCYFSVLRLRAVEGWVGAREQAQVAESQLYKAVMIILTIDTRFWFQIDVFVVSNIDITISIKHARSRHDYSMLSSQPCFPTLLLFCYTYYHYILLYFTTCEYYLILNKVEWPCTAATLSSTCDGQQIQLVTSAGVAAKIHFILKH